MKVLDLPCFTQSFWCLQDLMNTNYLLCSYFVMECPVLEGTRKGHWVQLLAAQDNPKNLTMCIVKMLLDSYTGTLHITEKTRLVNLQIQSHRASHLKEGFFLLVFHSSQWNEMSHFLLLFSKSKGHLGEGHTSLLYVSWASNKMQMREQRVATQ